MVGHDVFVLIQAKKSRVDADRCLFCDGHAWPLTSFVPVPSTFRPIHPTDSRSAFVSQKALPIDDRLFRVARHRGSSSYR